MKGFIYTMLLLSTIVFLYRSHIGFPDLATSFGDLYSAYNNVTYHTPLGDFSANAETERFEAAAGMPVQNLPPQNYYYATSSPRVSNPQASRNLPGN